MEEQKLFSVESSVNSNWELKLEEDEDEFRSCCEDEDELKEREEMAGRVSKDDLDEFSVKMFFKGVSVAQAGDSAPGISGIGVVIERSANVPVIQVQKRLDFYVEESVANYLALMDGLLEVLHSKVRRVFAFTDSKILYDQIMHESPDNPLLLALRQRILEHASYLETFVLKLVPSIDIEKPLHLARIAIGLVSFPTEEDESCEKCSICCEEKPSPMVITLKCFHKFCSHCMKMHVDGKVRSSKVPIRCPQLRCKHYITITEYRSFLPVNSYELLERALLGANVVSSEKIYCPYPNCLAVFDPRECLSTGALSLSQVDNNCVECPVCDRFICIECEVPWHASMSCEEYQDVPLEERDAASITLHNLAQNIRRRQCEQCSRIVEVTHGRYHMTCWCGHEFCYFCGAEYVDGRQRCHCALWNERNSHPPQESEQWAWDSFDSFSMMMDAYSEHERSQLALIQRFLAGGFSLSDHQPYQSPPRCTDSYVDAMKDLQQLPWLERFVSVISDNYYEEYIQ